MHTPRYIQWLNFKGYPIPQVQQTQTDADFKACEILEEGHSNKYQLLRTYIEQVQEHQNQGTCLQVCSYSYIILLYCNFCFIFFCLAKLCKRELILA